MNATIQTTENLTIGARIIRMVVGVAMLSPILFVSGYIENTALLALLAIAPIVSALDGYCPLLNWYRSIATSSHDFYLSKEQRVEYALLATVLIGSVFLPGESGGLWLALPLVGIYPAALAIFGEKLLSAVIASSHSKATLTVKQNASADILPLKQSSKLRSDHANIEHAA